MKIGAAWIVGIFFLVLKLAGVTKIAEWSWWWVLSPFWVWAIVCIIFFAVYESKRR